MKTKLLFLVLILVFITAINCTSYAENVESANSETQQFDFSQNTLPLDFKGQDIIQVYKEVAEKMPEEEKKESKKSYNDKVLALKFPELYIFTITDLESSYINDKEDLTIKLPYNWGARNEIELKNFKKTSKSQAWDEKRIMYITEFEYTRKYYLLLDRSLKTTKFQFKLSPDETKSLKENLGIVIFCNLKPFGSKLSYIVYDHAYPDKATKENPSVHEYEGYSVSVHLSEIWIYNRLNGKVYLKEKVNNKP
jgi:hypothetical protein